MNANRHTPGPWRIDDDDTGLILEPIKGYVIADVNPRNREANAHLIAAAPYLLKALRDLTFRARLAPEDAWIETAALAAIAKAKGEAA